MEFRGVWGVLMFAGAVLIVILLSKGALKALGAQQIAQMI